MSGEYDDGRDDRVHRLSRQAAGYRNKAKTFRTERDNLQKLVDELTTQLQATTEERDQFADALDASPGDHAAEVERLAGELRSERARRVFDAKALDLGARKDALDDLWSLMKYEPEGDEIDPDHLAGAIGETLRTKGYFRADGSAAPSPKANDAAQAGQRSPAGKVTRPVLSDAAGGDRGGRDATGRTIRVSKSQLQDPAWSLDKNNSQLMRDAKASGTLEFVE